jgi:hypothetical protein
MGQLDVEKLVAEDRAFHEEVQRLRAENERLRALLRRFVDLPLPSYKNTGTMLLYRQLLEEALNATTTG